MSLINDALKKAQRLRTEDSAGTAPPIAGAGGTRVAKRSEPRTSQQLVALAAGVVTLVVLTVVATVWLVNRPAAPKPAPTAAAPSKPTTNVVTAAPIIVAPAIKPTPSPVTTAPESRPVASNSAPVVRPIETAAQPATPAPTAITATTNPLIVTQPANAGEIPAAQPPPLESRPAVPPPPAAPVKGDERVHAFVDAIRVTGIRSSGEDSRVLMNDRVYRVTDIVERTLGVRLTKVDPGSLTFTDGNGAIYVKNF